MYSDTVLPEPVGAGHQHHAVRALDCIEQNFLLIRIVAQRVNPHLGLTRIQDTHDDFLAEQGRQGADPEIDGARFGNYQFHAAVLRYTFL